MTRSGNPSAAQPEEFGFPGSSRLLTKSEFDAVFQGRERRRTKGQFVVMYSQPNSLGRPRLGLITPKRQARRAVDRNRVKRLIRESFRVRQHDLGSFDFVVQLTAQFSGRLGGARYSQKDLQKDLRKDLRTDLRNDLRADVIEVWDRFVTIDRQRPPSRGRRQRGRSGG